MYHRVESDGKDERVSDDGSSESKFKTVNRH